MPRPSYPTLVATLIALLATGCGAAPVTSPPTGVDELRIPTPAPDPADFVEGIDNPYLPFAVGNEWVYESTGDDPETITVTVTDETKVIEGVTTTVVHDVVTGPDGQVVEDTYDWFAQDTDGNVWYFGEDTKEYDDRGRVDDAGSWQAGVDGARAGLVMPAEPRVGDAYRQEFYPGEAEDRAQVVSLDAAVDLAFGEYDDVLETEESTSLEPGLVERKYYARGVGVVLEKTVAGGSDRVELVEFTTP
ncbi:MAG: hypothetical protein ACRDOM_03375 [Nocardioides sp.]